MKRTTFIIVGIFLLIITITVCTTLILENQKKVMDSQKTMLDKMKDKSIDMIFGTSKEPFRSKGPIGFDTSKEA